MKLRLDRLYDTNHFTLGILTTPFGSFTTCEDAYHKPKIPGLTRIPTGTYNIKLRTKSGMASAYRERFGSKHTGMIWLQDVKNFEYIYIHVGNTHLDTDGCILIGRSLNLHEGFIGESVNAYKDFYPPVIEAVEKGKHVEIKVV